MQKLGRIRYVLNDLFHIMIFILTSWIKCIYSKYLDHPLKLEIIDVFRISSQKEMLLVPFEVLCCSASSAYPQYVFVENVVGTH